MTAFMNFGGPVWFPFASKNYPITWPNEKYRKITPPNWNGLFLLDLFCGGGGASLGYWLAGFAIVGVDTVRKRDYPFYQIKADALEILKDGNFIKSFDAIHASPPCQSSSITGNLARSQGRTQSTINLIEPLRLALKKTGKPFIIENVEGSPLEGVVLCGSMFKLGVQRHRIFETNWPLEVGLVCNHQTNSWPTGPKGKAKPIGIYGSLNDKIPKGGHTAQTIEEGRAAMGIEWLNWRDLTQSIPPKYTKFIGGQLRHINKK